MDNLKVISSTGVVHAVSDIFAFGGKGPSATGYSTMCNHMNMKKYSVYVYYHHWTETDKPVTCKRCLKALGIPTKNWYPLTGAGKILLIHGSLHNPKNVKVAPSKSTCPHCFNAGKGDCQMC